MSSVARIDHPVVEVVPIADDFVQGIVTIEDLGDNARFVLYAYHSVYEDQGQSQSVRVVVRKIVIPISAIQTCIEQALAFLTARVTRCAVEQMVRLPH